jgi:hypothetical protein
MSHPHHSLFVALFNATMGGKFVRLTSVGQTKNNKNNNNKKGEKKEKTAFFTENWR